MLKLGSRELLALLLCVLMANPPFITAAAASTPSRAVLGSISARGAVRVGGILAPSEGTLFAGDRVETNNGGAVIQYREGARIALSSESNANFSPSRVQLEKGLMTFQTGSGNGMIFQASTLRLQPISAKAAANVTMNDSKASVAVTEGALKVVDPSGAQLASLNAGEARLFEESSAAADPSSPSSASSPSSSAAPPQGGGGSSGSSRTWLIALGAAVVGTSLGIAGLVRANDSSNSADRANAALAQAQSQIAALTTQVAAAQASAAALQVRLNALGPAAAGLAAIAADLAAQVAALARAQASLSTIVSQLAAGQITPAQAQQQLATLQTTITGILNNIQADSAAAASCAVGFSAATPHCP